MEDNKILFSLIKQNKTEEFIKYLDAHPDVDVNIRDDNNYYLINYAIVVNNIKVVKALIDRDAKLDIYDPDDRPVLYIPIKYGFDEVLALLLKFNKDIIGIPLTDMRDKNGNIPLHYAIESNNMYAIKALLKAGSDINSVDKSGNNSLHLSIYTKNYDIVKLIIDHDVNINARTTTGETALHLACNFELLDISELLVKSRADINIQDFENEFTPLHYTVNLNNKGISALLLKNGANVNIQDFLGNTALHYSVIEENYDIYMMLVSSNYTKDVINFNLYNIDNQIPIHILLSKINSKNKDSMIQYIKLLLNGSNLNFQDRNGFTAMHYLSKNKSLSLWKSFIKILEEKKLNIFIKNNKNKRPIDYVREEDINKYVDMVNKSYLYIVRNTNFTWKQTWENMCVNKLFKGKLNKEEKKTIERYVKLDRIEQNQDICPVIVRNKLMELYLEKEPKCDYLSYPIKVSRKCIDIEEGTTVEYCTFTGITLDILIGLLFLLQKHKSACSTITTNFIDNKDLCSYYRSIGIITNTKCEFLNFEIVWVYHKLYFSDQFTDNFNKCLENKKKRFIIIPLGIELRQGSHANYLIYDAKLNEIERFEPYGSQPPYNFDYNPTLLDNLLENQFKKIKKGLKYIRPKEYIPKIGFQYLDVYEATTKIADPKGFCALWTIWYTDGRITYADIPRDKLIKKMMKTIKLRQIPFKEVIRNYSYDIIKMRDDIFEKIGITINDWLNEKYTEQNVLDLVNEFKILIKNLT